MELPHELLDRHEERLINLRRLDLSYNGDDGLVEGIMNLN